MFVGNPLRPGQLAVFNTMRLVSLCAQPYVRRDSDRMVVIAQKVFRIMHVPLFFTFSGILLLIKSNFVNADGIFFL